MQKTNDTAGNTGTTKARLTPGRQWIGIRNLEFTEEIQPRASLDRGWVNDLSKFHLEGSEFPPIKVFQTSDGRLIPGEGHHRSMAMASAGEEQILCDVVDGTMEDAVVFAAGSNKSNGVKPMGPKDITKAVEMLLAIDKWWGRSAKMIGEYVGCHSSKVTQIRHRIHLRDGRTLPEKIETSTGEQRMPHRPGIVGDRSISRTSNRTGYRAHYLGREISGPTEQAVRDKLDALKKQQDKKLSTYGMKAFLLKRGFSSIYPASRPYRGIHGAMFRDGILCIACCFSSLESLPASVGCLIAARRYKGDLSVRMVVFCYPEDGPEKVIDLYKQEGFEFLTPEELVESLKTADAGPDEAAP